MRKSNTPDGLSLSDFEEVAKRLKDKEPELDAMIRRKESEMSEGLDEKYLGQKYPGNSRQRLILLNDLQELLEKHGEEWVRQSKDRLLSEAEFIVKEGVI